MQLTHKLAIAIRKVFEVGLQQFEVLFVRRLLLQFLRLGVLIDLLSFSLSRVLPLHQQHLFLQRRIFRFHGLQNLQQRLVFPGQLSVGSGKFFVLALQRFQLSAMFQLLAYVVLDLRFLDGEFVGEFLQSLPMILCLLPIVEGLARATLLQHGLGCLWLVHINLSGGNGTDPIRQVYTDIQVYIHWTEMSLLTAIIYS